jgi:cbb3-type cytochrome oxidase subunit 3
MTAKERLKSAAASLVAAFDWVGGHLTGLLTISVAVLAFLFTQERKKKQGLETDLELKDQADKIAVDTQGVQDAKDKTEDSGAAYDDALKQYKSQRKSGN